LPLEQLILEQPPGAEAIEMDVLFVGAGPAGLSGAIEWPATGKRDQETAADSRISISVCWKGRRSG
jgi:hypothetical protein